DRSRESRGLRRTAFSQRENVRTGFAPCRCAVLPGRETGMRTNSSVVLHSRTLVNLRREKKRKASAKRRKCYPSGSDRRSFERQFLNNLFVQAAVLERRSDAQGVEDRAAVARPVADDADAVDSQQQRPARLVILILFFEIFERLLGEMLFIDQ